MRTFDQLQPVDIFPVGRERALYDSLIFANVARMASTDESVTQDDRMTDFSKSCPVPTEATGVLP